MVDPATCLAVSTLDVAQGFESLAWAFVWAWLGGLLIPQIPRLVFDCLDWLEARKERKARDSHNEGAV